MAIVETKSVTRPNTSVVFFNETNAPTRLAVKAATESYIADGKYTIAKNVSGDGLTQTTVTTYDSLATFSEIDSILGIDLDAAYTVYAQANSLTHGTPQYSLTGIDAPFTCTTTYIYGANTGSLYPNFESFINVIEASNALISFTNTGTQLIAVHQYDNSADFSANHWQDFTYVSSLNTAGVTRTIEYALV